MLLTNEYLARALNNIGVEAGNTVMNKLAMATRYLALINTAFNPEFIVSNLTKDLQTAFINLSDEQTTNFRNQVMKNWKKSLKAARRVQKDPNAKGEWENYYRNYAAAGGKVGFFQSLKTIDQKHKELQKEINQLGTEKASKDFLNPKRPTRLVKKGAKLIVDFISNTNTAVENAIRLSAYQTAIDNGFSEIQAASLAKNLTVNFNRKGEWGGWINSLYLFYNASIQGSVRMFQAMGRSKKVARIGMGIIAGSFFLDMFNRAIADDDDDGRNKYDKINGWIKGHNLIIMNPSDVGPGYVAIPMPWGYNWLAIMGQTMSSSMPEDLGGSRKREVTIGENATRASLGFLDAFSPIGTGSHPFQVLSPSVMKPGVDLILNEDYAGRTIYPPDNPFDGNAGPPDSQQYWNASWLSTQAAQTVNNLTGGSPVESSTILGGAFDVSPETLDFMAKNVFGGAGMFGLNTLDFGGKILSGNWDELSFNKVPFSRKFLKAQPTFVNKQVYFDLRDEIKIAENLIEYLTEERAFDELRKARKENRKLLMLSSSLKDLESTRRKLRKTIKQIEGYRGMSDETKERRIKLILDREGRLMSLFIKRADRILG
mgnify:FL=1